MSKKNIENYIPKVMEVLKDEFQNGEIPSAYNGYISSFGASIIQSGLLPTLALFENTNASTKENKEYLTYLIVRVLTGKKEDISLLQYVLKENNPQHKQRILDISIAIKLSIRTFKLVDKDIRDE
jgi:CRISPR-associated protein Cmr5